MTNEYRFMAMRILRWCWLALVALVLQSTFAWALLPPAFDDFQSVYAKARQSVVTILTYETGGTTPAGFGSGFYVASDIVVTNAHVVLGAGFLEVKKNLRDDPIRVVRVLRLDKAADVALLQTEDSGIALSLAASRSGSGESVVVISSPLGLEKTASQGIVSGYRKRNDRVYLQITAPISPGSSGGPILNRRGQVVGITAFMIDGKHIQNLNFGIPSATIQEILGDTRPQRSESLHIQNDDGEIVITD